MKILLFDFILFFFGLLIVSLGFIFHSKNCTDDFKADDDKSFIEMHSHSHLWALLPTLYWFKNIFKFLIYVFGYKFSLMHKRTVAKLANELVSVLAVRAPHPLRPARRSSPASGLGCSSAYTVSYFGIYLFPALLAGSVFCRPRISPRLHLPTHLLPLVYPLEWLVAGTGGGSGWGRNYCRGLVAARDWNPKWVALWEGRRGGSKERQLLTKN